MTVRAKDLKAGMYVVNLGYIGKAVIQPNTILVTFDYGGVRAYSPYRLIYTDLDRSHRKTPLEWDYSPNEETDVDN